MDRGLWPDSDHLAELAGGMQSCYTSHVQRLVQCVKLGRELPGVRYQPFRGELGRRIYQNVSQEAWQMWIEHSKMIVNEYRLDLTSEKAHEVLKEQCAAFFFGEGEQAAPPPDYVPAS